MIKPKKNRCKKSLNITLNSTWLEIKDENFDPLYYFGCFVVANLGENFLESKKTQKIQFKNISD